MNYLKSLQINGFRGFIDRFKINFAIPTGISGSGLTVIVGPNGAGKSSIIEALSWCILVKDKPNNNILNNVLYGDLILERDDGKKVTLTHTEGKTLSITKDFSIADEEFAYISTEGIRLNMVGDDDKKVELYHEYPDIGRMSLTSPNLKAKRLRFFIEKEAQCNNIIPAIAKYFPDFKGFYLESSFNMNFLKYKNSRDLLGDATELGTGFAAVSYISSYFEIWNEAPSSTIIFEEPELYLHPQFQRKLNSQIRKLSAERQVILVTHSPYFINWADFDAGATLLRVNKTKSGSNIINHMESTNKYYSLLKSGELDWQKPHMFDNASKEILYAEKVLFVEGQEDVGLLRMFALENSIDLNFEIFGYGAGGAGNMKALLQLASDLGVKSAALFDSNAKSEINQCQNLFPQFLIDVLPTPDIRDKPSKGVIGIFDQGGQIKSEWQDSLKTILMRFNLYFNSASD